MQRKPVDVVAIILACALAGTSLGILAATTVQIVKGTPEITLSDNATQILVGSIGALTGLLGGYMGSRRPHPPPDDEGNDDDADHPGD